MINQKSKRLNLLKTTKVVLLWIILIAADTAAQTLVKIGAKNSDIMKLKFNYFIIFGYSIYIICFITWLQILKFTRLAIALATAALVYVSVAFASHFFLGETISISIIIGTICISTGVFIIGYNQGKKEEAKNRVDTHL
jgi:drug/metabolite transporter (DMT)-like permease